MLHRYTIITDKLRQSLKLYKYLFYKYCVLSFLCMYSLSFSFVLFFFFAYFFCYSKKNSVDRTKVELVVKTCNKNTERLSFSLRNGRLLNTVWKVMQQCQHRISQVSVSNECQVSADKHASTSLSAQRCHQFPNYFF